MPMLIDGAGERRPLALDPHVGFVDIPRVSHGPMALTPCLFEHRDIPLHSPQDRRVGSGDPALRHHLDKISIAEFVGDRPPHAQENHVGIEMATVELVWRDGYSFQAGEYARFSTFAPFPRMQPSYINEIRIVFLYRC